MRDDDTVPLVPRTKRPRLYDLWRGMIRRCHDPKHHNYQNYGARGIVVCDAWRRSFTRFAMDMGERPFGKTLGRINNDQGYSLGNCRWETPAQQAVNKRTNRLLTAFGETKTVSEWVIDARCVVSRQSLLSRLLLGWPVEIAMKTPVGEYRHRRVERTCEFCGIKFTVTKSVLRRRPAKYCDALCATYSRSKP